MDPVQVYLLDLHLYRMCRIFYLEVFEFYSDTLIYIFYHSYYTMLYIIIFETNILISKYGHLKEYLNLCFRKIKTILDAISH